MYKNTPNIKWGLKKPANIKYLSTYLTVEMVKYVETVEKVIIEIMPTLKKVGLLKSRWH